MILVGDVRTSLAALPADSVQTIVTSPPYYGLRDYGVDGQIGLEKVPDCGGWLTGDRCGPLGSRPGEKPCFICTLVDVFAAARRALRRDGTCWVNMGDTYSGGGRGGHTGAITGHGKDESRAARSVSDSQRQQSPRTARQRTTPGLAL